MAQAKKSSARAKAKPAAYRAAKSAAESTRASTENVVKLGSSAVKDFLNNSTGEAQKAQEKAFAIGRENAAHLAKSADAATKMLYEVIGVSRDGIESCIECGNMTAALAKDVSSEAFEAANKAFADNLEISKEFFACRTINDMLELHNRAMSHAIDNFFNQSVKLSGMLFEFSSEALEPINERVAQATAQLSKALAA